MSSREGHDAMALQREQVLMLLGAVTNPDHSDLNPSPRARESPCALLNDGSVSKNHSKDTFFELKGNVEETTCKYESIPTKSKKKKKILEQENGSESTDLSASMGVENNFVQELNEAENEREKISPKCSQVSSDNCRTNGMELIESSPLLVKDQQGLSNNTQSKTGHLPEGLEDIIKRAQMYTSQRLQHTSLAVSEVIQGVETSLIRPPAGSGCPTRASAFHDTSEQSAGNLGIENSEHLNLSSPQILHDYSHLFTQDDEYTKGCKWSPDGELLMVLSSSQKFSIIEPQIEELTAQATDEQPQESVLTVTEGELVYDYHWYPFMSVSDLNTNCFVCCCRGLPVHLWDAGKGSLVCSYQPYNHLDELAPAYSLGFSDDGSRLVCGFNKIIRVFDTARPGRKCTSMCAKKQNGIISCFSHHPHLHHVMAAGSYLGSVGLYSHNSGRAFCVLHGHTGGVTQIQFSSDGNRLYTGARMDDELLCWDVRQMGRVLHSYKRSVRSNQRVAFQLTSSGQRSVLVSGQWGVLVSGQWGVLVSGQWGVLVSGQWRVLVSGSTDGLVMSWHEDNSHPDWPRSPDHCFQAHDDCVNGISIHPQKPLLATSSGQRHPLPHPDDSKSQARQPPKPSVRLWTLGGTDVRRL
ncbi:WD40 repeat [Trinorchestia longiramus]|nr:WD40 repeat [Trinorchestia longiramus]